MQLVNLKQNTKEWLQFRRSHICASDAPIIMGVSPYKKLDKLREEKLKCYESITTSYMQRGKDLEPIALEMFEKETGLIMFPMVGKHEGIEWMAASFDGVSIDRKHIVEIKCPGKKDHELALQGKIPPKYYPQIQHQLCVSDLKMAYYYSFDGDQGIILEVNIDQDYILNMVEKEFDFWYSLAGNSNSKIS